MSDTVEIDKMNVMEEVPEDQIKSLMPRLPLSKVKKIAKMDSEYILTANTAMVATTFATELFVQSLVESALAMNQLNQNNRNKQTKNSRLTYNDLAQSVVRKECFQFLEDGIPKTAPTSLVNTTTRAPNGADPNTTVEIEEQNSSNKQKTLPFFKHSSLKDIDMDVEEEEEEEKDDEDEEDEEDEEEEVATELHEQLNEVEQMDHVNDVDALSDTDTKTRMALNRNQEDNNDGSDSDESM